MSQSPSEGPGQAHPCDGAWRPLDPFIRTGADPWSSCAEGFTGFTVSWSTITADPERWEQYDDARESTGGALRIDLAEGTGRMALEAALEYQPELIRVPAPSFPIDDDGLHAIARLDAAATRAETALTLSAPIRSAAADLQVLIAAAISSQAVVAFGLDGFGEGALESLGTLEGLAVFCPGLEFASAYRLGATAFDGTFGLLGPVACSEALGLAEDNPGEARQLERRLQRFIDGPFERATRALPPDERAVALAGTFAFFEEEGGDPPVAFAEMDWLELRAAIDEQGLFPPDLT
ncbi:MAG: hypothetical protein ACJA0P_001099 [Planctomycetota bacterium]